MEKRKNPLVGFFTILALLTSQSSMKTTQVGFGHVRAETHEGERD
jgi:hypothetical protein